VKQANTHKPPHVTLTDDQLLSHAQQLKLSNQKKQAIECYGALIQRNPEHLVALMEIAELLHETGYTSAAQTALEQVIHLAPDHWQAHLKLAHLLFQQNKFDSARAHYETVLHQYPDHTHAHQGMALIYYQSLERSKYLHHHQLAFRDQPLRHTLTTPSSSKPRILILMEGLGGDVPWERLFSTTLFDLSALVVNYFDPSHPLPPHDLVFNAIGDADLCEFALNKATQILAHTSRPVLNKPSNVQRTGRLSHAERLGQLPGVKTARTYLLPKEQIAQGELPAQLQWPVLVRSPGYQTGQHFEKAHHRDELKAMTHQLPGESLLVMQALDARDAQGWYRKYRIMWIDGHIYPVHLALSRHWKVHYFSAAMAQHPELREIEAAFLADMTTFLGPEHIQCLQNIGEQLNLDYAGLDFSIDPQGQLIVFEANSTMVIARPSNDAHWAYRQAPIERAIQAIQDMLLRHAKPQETPL
jgi:glutathione synthase/RimK-type ligase-like ATP-grasp enzyme